MPACTLTCYGGGLCQAGAKSYEIVLNPSVNASDLQYCLCPNTTTGQSCEQEVTKCGGGYCMYGGVCVDLTDPSTGGVGSICDCTNATTATAAFAGQYCENPATAFCAPTTLHNGRAFCVNGGTCAAGG